LEHCAFMSGNGEIMLFGGMRTKGIVKASQKDKPLLTVVTVVYNGEGTLEETILSVINQTYTNIEYIIVDGASSDRTLDIIRKHEDRIDYWMSEPDKNVFDAMNKGIKLTTGSFIGFLNAGDFYENNSCDIIKNVILQNPDVDVIYGNTNLVINIWNKVHFYTIYPSSVIDDKILSDARFCHQSAFERKTNFDKLGYFENVKFTGDWLHYILLFNNDAKFLYVNKTISNYLDGGISSTVDGFKESIIYRKKMGVLKKTDYFRLWWLYMKNNFLYRKIAYPFRWYIKLSFEMRKK